MTSHVETGGFLHRVPAIVFIALATPHLTAEDPRDLVALRVVVRGERGGKPCTVQYDVLDRYDEERGITAMMRTTGYSLALTAVMQASGRIRSHGVHTPDECVPAGEYIRGMKERGVEIRRTEV